MSTDEARELIDGEWKQHAEFVEGCLKEVGGGLLEVLKAAAAEDISIEDKQLMLMRGVLIAISVAHTFGKCGDECTLEKALQDVWEQVQKASGEDNHKDLKMLALSAVASVQRRCIEERNGNGKRT